MSVDALPTATLKMIPAEFFLCLTKTDLHRRAGKGNTQQAANVPAFATWNTVAEEKLDLAAEDIRRHNERALGADKLFRVGLSPTDVPLNLPHLRSTMLVDYSIPLRCLIAKGWRIACQISYLVTTGRLARDTRALMASANSTPEAVPLQYFRFPEPDPKVRCDFSNKCLLALIQTIEEVSIPSIRFVKRPCFDTNAILNRLINQL